MHTIGPTQLHSPACKVYVLGPLMVLIRIHAQSIGIIQGALVHKRLWGGRVPVSQWPKANGSILVNLPKPRGWKGEDFQKPGRKEPAAEKGAGTLNERTHWSVASLLGKPQTQGHVFQPSDQLPGLLIGQTSQNSGFESPWLLSTQVSILGPGKAGEVKSGCGWASGRPQHSLSLWEWGRVAFSPSRP